MEEERCAQTPQTLTLICAPPVQRPLLSSPLAFPLDGKPRATPWPPSIGQARGGRGAPIPLGGVSRGGVCGSAYHFTSDRVLNGDGAGSEAERGRRPLPADWPRRDAMPSLDSAHARACWLACTKNAAASWRQDGREDGVVVIVVAGDGVFQLEIAAHSHLFTH